MANDHTAWIYFALWVYVVIRTVGNSKFHLYVHFYLWLTFLTIGMITAGLNVWCSLWPITTYTMFITTRMIENMWLNIKLYAILIVPINIGLFGAGISVFIFCPDWLGDSIVIYLIIFSLQCIQMLIFICIITIMIVEGISVNRLASNFNDDTTEYLLERGLQDSEIEEILANKPNKIGNDETWSIWLCEFEDSDGVMQVKSWKHIFHQGWISGWLVRDSRWPNWNTDVRTALTQAQ